jgi:hypothetical protein
MAAIGAASTFLSPRGGVPAFFLRIQASLLVLTVVVAAIHAGACSLGWLRVGRLTAAAGFVVAILTASNLLHHAALIRGPAPAGITKPMLMATQTLACAAAAPVVGLPLAMAVLLFTRRGELDAAGRTLRTLWRTLLLAVLVRAALLIGGVGVLATLTPPARPLDWQSIVLRCAIGFAVVPFVTWVGYREAPMRRAAWTIFAAALCGLVAETFAMALAADTGLPF